MCDSKDHMNHMHEGCGCSKDAASGKMEEGKEGVKDMASGVSDKTKSMMHKDKDA